MERASWSIWRKFRLTCVPSPSKGTYPLLLRFLSSLSPSRALSALRDSLDPCDEVDVSGGRGFRLNGCIVSITRALVELIRLCLGVCVRSDQTYSYPMMTET